MHFTLFLNQPLIILGTRLEEDTRYSDEKPYTRIGVRSDTLQDGSTQIHCRMGILRYTAGWEYSYKLQDGSTHIHCRMGVLRYINENTQVK